MQEQDWKIKDVRGEVFVGENEKALLFASDNQLNLQQTTQLIYFDSTLKVVPAPYYQIFPVFAPHADYAFPVFLL